MSSVHFQGGEDVFFLWSSLLWFVLLYNLTNCYGKNNLTTKRTASIKTFKTAYDYIFLTSHVLWQSKWWCKTCKGDGWAIPTTWDKAPWLESNWGCCKYVVCCNHSAPNKKGGVDAATSDLESITSLKEEQRSTLRAFICGKDVSLLFRLTLVWV